MTLDPAMSTTERFTTAVADTLEPFETIEAWPSGKMLFREGSAPSGVYYLHSGEVDLCFSSPKSGEAKSLLIADPGDRAACREPQAGDAGEAGIVGLLHHATQFGRSRFRFGRRVRTLSAEGRMSAWILTLVPIILFGVLFHRLGGLLAFLRSNARRLRDWLSSVRVRIGTRVLGRRVTGRCRTRCKYNSGEKQ